MILYTAILQSYLKDETLHDDVDLDRLATQTDGFSGSDLKSQCPELTDLLILLTDCG